MFPPPALSPRALPRMRGGTDPQAPDRGESETLAERTNSRSETMHGKLWLAGAWLAAGLLTAELPGEPAAAPVKIHIISGSKSYKSEASLREFKSFLEDRYRVECSASWAQ